MNRIIGLILTIVTLSSCSLTPSSTALEKPIMPSATPFAGTNILPTEPTSTNATEEALGEQPRTRTEYLELDKAITSLPCDMNAFPNADFIYSHPILLGMCMAGYPDEDGGDPSLVKAYYPKYDTVVLIVIEDGKFIGDDSIRSKDIRVDLVLRDGKWIVDWIGGRWKCRTGRGHQDWGSEHCS